MSVAQNPNSSSPADNAASSAGAFLPEVHDDTAARLSLYYRWHRRSSPSCTAENAMLRSAEIAEKCAPCGGFGVEKGRICATCIGAGASFHVEAPPYLDLATISYDSPMLSACSLCKGCGTVQNVCPHCEGERESFLVDASFFGGPGRWTCPVCQGEGEIFAACPRCYGPGTLIEGSGYSAFRSNVEAYEFFSVFFLRRAEAPWSAESGEIIVFEGKETTDESAAWPLVVPTIIHQRLTWDQFAYSVLGHMRGRRFDPLTGRWRRRSLRSFFRRQETSSYPQRMSA